MLHLNEKIDYGQPLRVFFWFRHHGWVSKGGALTLLAQFVNVMRSACGSNNPVHTDSALVHGLAPLVRQAAKNDVALLAELCDTAETLLAVVEKHGEPVFRLDSMSPACAELCGVAIQALILLYTPPENERRLHLVL